MDLSIIIPARDEELNISSVLCKIRNEFSVIRCDYEVVVVDDGSRDATSRIVTELGRDARDVRLVANSEPFGIGSAIRKGIAESRGRYVIIAMADGSDEPRDMVRFWQKVTEGYDCCFGDRWDGTFRVVGYPPFKRFVNRLANRLIGRIFHLPYEDVTNAFKAYSREVLDGISPLTSRSFEIFAEMPLKAILGGYSYTVLPNRWYGRRRGESKFFFKELSAGYLGVLCALLFGKFSFPWVWGRRPRVLPQISGN